MSIGSFILIRNEAEWIGPHLAAWLPYLDEMVFLDGNSTDGTLEILRDFRASHPDGGKITLVENRDVANLQDDYVRRFNEALRTLKTDWAFFLHPDMIPENPEALRCVGDDGVAFSTHMRSFAGEPGGKLYELMGRGKQWKNIHRLRNPDLGAHYHGAYGAYNEDVYFSEITGGEHEFHGSAFSRYPYDVKDSGLRILHFSDVRARSRRISRMISCLVNQGAGLDLAAEIAASHPRVTLSDGQDHFGTKYKMDPATYPPVFDTWRNTLKVAV